MPSRMNALPTKVPRAAKRTAGRTPISETPLRLRLSGVALTPAIERRTYQLLGRRLARFGTFIERVDVRFKDVNGPRGGADTLARIQLTVAGRPTVFVEERAHDADQALSRAATSVARAMDRSVGKLGKRGLAAPAPTHPPRKSKAPRPRAAAPARSRTPPATHEGQPSHRRGVSPRPESSATKPSRKSTRKSDTRLKGAKLSRRVRRAKHAPKARASRAQAQRRRSRGR